MRVEAAPAPGADGLVETTNCRNSAALAGLVGRVLERPYFSRDDKLWIRLPRLEVRNNGRFISLDIYQRSRFLLTTPAETPCPVRVARVYRWVLLSFFSARSALRAARRGGRDFFLRQAGLAGPRRGAVWSATTTTAPGNHRYFETPSSSGHTVFELACLNWSSSACCRRAFHFAARRALRTFWVRHFTPRANSTCCEAPWTLRVGWVG